jgi:AraC-like DNA-binding protein
MVYSMKTVFEHTQSRILVIPQSLYSMKDVKVVCQLRNSAIFYKSLEQDLRNIAFYTNTPCFVYIDSGTEVITSSNHDTVTLTAGSAIFLPQGLNLQSDFVKETRSLKAMLAFFDDEIITEYLTKCKRTSEHNRAHKRFSLLEDRLIFSRFFASLNPDIKKASYLSGKFLELLHLIAFVDTNHSFHSLLLSTKRLPPKKNLTRLLDTVEILHLSVNELAHISGRSLSTFNRDFKATYQMSPKQWLLEHRLSKAKELLESESHSVTDVAMMVGYSNVSHFIKSFKSRYGVTPSTVKCPPMT